MKQRRVALLADTHDHGFIAELDFNDLLRLRAITRRAYFNIFGANASEPRLETIDGMINELGPKVALKVLKMAVDDKLV